MSRRAEIGELPSRSVNTIERIDDVPKIDGVVVGRLVSQAAAQPLVEYEGNPTGNFVVARSVVKITAKDIGREVVLLFEQGCFAKPVIMGVIQPLSDQAQETLLDQIVVHADNPVEAKVDDEKLILTADREVTLKCGEASITLTRAGKILIKGTYVVSRSTGVNRIKGGSVQIN